LSHEPPDLSAGGYRWKITSPDTSLSPQSGLLPALRFRADIPIQRMLRLQIGFEPIHIVQSKFLLLDSPHTDQDI
jgi:hypothetical protein